MEQIIEAVEPEVTVESTAVLELSLAQLALVGGGEVQVTFD